MTIVEINQAALDLANLLKSGLLEEFENGFRFAAKSMSLEGLVNCLNEQLKAMASEPALKVLLSQREGKGESYVTVVGDSRFFGDSWTVRRQKFTI